MEVEFVLGSEQKLFKELTTTDPPAGTFAGRSSAMNLKDGP
jgi:hypothetical protein